MSPCLKFDKTDSESSGQEPNPTGQSEYHNLPARENNVNTNYAGQALGEKVATQCDGDSDDDKSSAIRSQDVTIITHIFEAQCTKHCLSNKVSDQKQPSSLRLRLSIDVRLYDDHDILTAP